MTQDKKRKKGAVSRPESKPASDPVSNPAVVPTAVPTAVPTHIPPPPPDTDSPVFAEKSPSFVVTVCKILLFSIPTTVVLIGGILFFAQNTVVKFIPEMQTVYATLGIVRPHTTFKDIANIPNPNQALIAQITQVALQQDNKNMVYGVIYNTTKKAHYKTATLTLAFLTENNTVIATQDHTVNISIPPRQHTAFEIPLSHVPTYAKNIVIHAVY